MTIDTNKAVNFWLMFSMVYKQIEVRRIVLKYAKVLQKRITVKKIILFVSYASGDGRDA